MAKDMIKAAVIGGGAAGLTAAIVLSRRLGKGSVVLLEKQKKLGRKLLATGNGRCNISNEQLSPHRYHGDDALIRSVLSRFSVNNLKAFFRELGVLLRADAEGRLYPYSNQAATILRALEEECQRQQVTILLNSPVIALRKEQGHFVVTTPDQSIRARQVILAAGSKASPSLGADGSGYELLRSMGIPLTPLFPALVPVPVKENCRSLKGVRAKGSVTLQADQQTPITRQGEIQFTEQGLSGICVFDLSGAIGEFYRFGTLHRQPCHSITLTADVMSDFSFEEIRTYLREVCQRTPHCPGESLLSGVLNDKLAQYLARFCGIQGKPAAALRPHELSKLAAAAKKLPFTPLQPEDFHSAQVTAGGVGCDAVDPHTLMCRQVSNLFVCGELLNVNGDCGGFNLHFALGSAFCLGGLPV